MPPLLTAASSMMCPHGGTVIATPGSTRAQAGAPVLRGSDTFTVAGCTFQISGAPHPCMSVNWVQTATRVQHGGDLVLNQSSVGLCVAGDQTPQGPVVISSTQTSASGL
ncbi:MAG TPA: hypothetical protein VKS60_19915 [Stellaceae bacterium]|nr:hypothetical protein [Stellaceae bacterium]